MNLKKTKKRFSSRKRTNIIIRQEKKVITTPRHYYYIDDLKESYFREKRFEQEGDEFHRLMKEHFEETYKFLKESSRLIPLNQAELESKLLDPELLIRIKEDSLRFDNRVLILDLDETLIHARYVLDEEESTFKLPLEPGGPTVNVKLLIRPGMKQFLEEMSKLYTLVLFTASTQDYAEGVLDIIDPDQEFFKFRLFRQHCVKTLNRKITKDLRIFGDMDLSKILLVDNSAYNFANQISNGVPILSYIGEYQKDRELTKLGEFLQNLIENKDSSQDLGYFNSYQFRLHAILQQNNIYQACDQIVNS